MSPRVLPLILVALPAVAATPRIAVLPFSGAKAGFVREQLLAELCGQLSCIPPADIKGRKGTDWVKVHASAIDAVVSGNIVSVHGKPQLKIELRDAPAKPLWSTAVKLDRRGELAPSQDRMVTVLLERHLRALKHSETGSDGAAKPAQADAAFEARRGAPPPPSPAAAAPAPSPKAAAEPQQVASKSTPEVREPERTGTPTVSGRRYKPLPPDLLNFTPRI